jgi:hypothetical protein
MSMVKLTDHNPDKTGYKCYIQKWGRNKEDKWKKFLPDSCLDREMDEWVETFL